MSSRRQSMDLSMATCNAERAAMKSSEYRKVIKPLLERRRRARINNCLDELKALILETAQPENTDASKLEKADILELTVQHLKSLRHGVMPPTIGTRRSTSTAAAAAAADQQVVVNGPDKYRAGFAECAHEVSAFISALGGVETEVKSRLVSHLARCVSRFPVQPTSPISSFSSSSSSSSSSPSSASPMRPSPMMTSPLPPHQHQYETVVPFSRIAVTTPTPPPSPHTQCGTPTTVTSPTEYVVPVSPISPVGPSYNHQQQYGPYGDHGQYRNYAARCGADTYVYPEVRSVSRSSSVGTPSSSSYEGYFSDRAESPVSSSPMPLPPSSFHNVGYTHCVPAALKVSTLSTKTEEKPWRPW